MSNIECSWIIANNRPVLDTILDLNINEQEYSFYTFDFKNLFTSITHKDIIETIGYLVMNTFKDQLIIYYKGKRLHVSLSYFKEIMETLIYNCFIKVDGVVYRQIIGIPMGECYSTNLANLYLHSYEAMYKNLINVSNDFKYAFRFVDDLIIIGKSNLMARHNIYNDIYILKT